MVFVSSCCQLKPYHTTYICNYAFHFCTSWLGLMVSNHLALHLRSSDELDALCSGSTMIMIHKHWLWWELIIEVICVLCCRKLTRYLQSNGGMLLLCKVIRKYHYAFIFLCDLVTNTDQCFMYSFYPHMPIGMLRIYCLLFVSLFVCLQHRNRNSQVNGQGVGCHATPPTRAVRLASRRSACGDVRQSW